MRIVDIEVVQASPLRFDIATVRNTGSYGSGWWWYYDRTSAQVDALLAENNARLIDVEPYITADGLRYAVVMKPNSGPDAVADSGWEPSVTFAELTDWIDDNPGRRIHDIQPYSALFSDRYTFTWIENSGDEQSDWWILLDTSLDVINTTMVDNQARLVDLERHASGGWSAVMVPGDGQAWWWVHDVPAARAVEIAGNYGARITDFERYSTLAGSQIAMVMRRNVDDVTLAAVLEIRDQVPVLASSGIYCRRLDGGYAAGTNQGLRFEPASAMKTMHLFASLWHVGLHPEHTLATPMAYAVPAGYPGGDYIGSLQAKDACPLDQDSTWQIEQSDLSQTLVNMMTWSSNPATEAIRAHFGTDAIEEVIQFFGAENTELNHTLGCLGYSWAENSRNVSTLEDFAAIHGAVAAGELGEHRDDFYAHMAGTSLANQIVDQELATSSLDASDRSEFRSLVLATNKGGSYSLWGSDEAHVSFASYLRLPERNGDCNVIEAEYFVGGFINDAPASYFGTPNIMRDNSLDAREILYRGRIQAAIDTWDNNPCEVVRGDLNGDGTVDGADIGHLLLQWGQCQDCEADLDGDGDVDGGDFGAFLVLWER